MNKIGRFGEYGGQYVPEIVMNAVNELNEAYETYKNDPEFLAQLRQLYRDYANRPSLLYYAEKMTKDLGGAKVYLKREDLNHTGAHKINNVLGQILLAKRMGKKRIIAETGAGQHGVATATVAALFDMECVVYMGAEDVERQSLNAYRMELLGAKIHAVESGTRTLKDAINEAMRDWATNIETTFYCIGSVMGPHPYPTMVRDFQKIIGEETKEQMKEIEGKLPDAVFACVGGGSNAMGMFYDFIPDESVRLIGAEAAGRGEDKCRRKAVFIIPAARIVTILRQLASIIHASNFIRRPRRAVQNLLDAIGQRRGVSRIRTGNRQHHQHYHPQDHQQILFHGKSSISVLPFHPYQRFTSHISSSQSKFFRFSSRKRHFSAAIHEKFSP